MKYTMKGFLLTLIAGIFCTNCYSQSDYNYNSPHQGQSPGKGKVPQNNEGFNPTGYIIGTFGIAVPVGGFTYNTGTGYGGYAISGVKESISAGIPLANTNLGIALMYANYDNPFDLNAYVSTQTVYNSNYEYYGVSADDYASSAIMAGVFYTWPVKRFSFDLRAMGGVVLCAMPEITYAASATDPNATNDFEWDYAPSRSAAFGYDFGAGIRYKLRRDVCLSLNADFLGAKLSFLTNQLYTDQYGNQYVTAVSGNIPMSQFDISLGLGYQFK